MNYKEKLHDLSDEVLVERIAKTRDSALFEVLYDRYVKIVYNKCFLFVLSNAEAEDLTQDIFLKFYLSINKFSGKSKFSTWFYSFTYNFCINHVNRNEAFRMQKVSMQIEEEQNSIIEINDEYIFQMKYEKLEKALIKISPEERMILLLKYQDDTSIKDLQELLGLKESAVKMRLNRAKSNLIAIYNHLDYEN